MNEEYRYNWNSTFLMCRPSYFSIAYEINPWMCVNNHSDHGLALDQWTALHHAIIRLGGYVKYVEPEPGLPDQCFTANAALVKGNKAVISQFLHPERRGEEEHFRRWFEGQGYETFIPRHFFEGAGDALFSGDTLFCGHGFRSGHEAYEEIREMLELDSLVFCCLMDPYYYHLDTCFCPLSLGRAMYVQDAFSEESRKEMEKHVELIPIPPEEGRRFACNAVIVDDHIIVPKNCHKTRNILDKLGYNTIEFDMNEFIKSGGACKCLTLRLS